jgi:hypothetical protein
VVIIFSIHFAIFCAIVAPSETEINYLEVHHLKDRQNP